MKTRYYKTEYGDIVTCDSCSSEAPLSEYNNSYGQAPPKRNLCDICACTFIGIASGYPQQYDNVSLFQSLAQMGNLLLDKLTPRTWLKPFAKLQYSPTEPEVSE